MTPADVMKRLEAEGFEASLNLKVKGEATPSEGLSALIRKHRDPLLEHLAREFGGGPNVPRPAHLQFHGDLLHSLMVWTARYYELRLEHPGGVILNAKPEHVGDALNAHPWGVVCDQTKAVLVTWGDVPRYALMDKRDLKTEKWLEHVLPEEVAA